MKKCPFCAEEIQDEAIVCRFCGRDLTPPITQNPPETQKSKNPPLAPFAIIALIVFIAVLVLLRQSNSSPHKAEPTSTPQEGAWYACTLFIQRQLDISINDAQRYTSSGVTELSDNRYKVKVYYPEQGAIYICELSRHSNGDMELLSLEAQ